MAQPGTSFAPPAGMAARASRIAVSATAAMAIEAERLRGEGRELVDFGVGEPDFPTPAHIKAAAVAAIDANFTKYTHTSGIAQLRQAIVERHARDFGSGYLASQALVTAGGKHALFNAISMLVDHGDEVIVPAPYWVSFCEQIRYAGGTPVVVPTDEARGFALDFDALAAALTPRTKAIVLNSPANPSGAVFAPELFRAVLELCRQRGLWLISDECYCRFVYDGQVYSAASEGGGQDRLVVAGSLSKTYAMTGWRIGYALAPEPLIQAMLNLQSHVTSNAASMAQKAAVAALEGTQQPVPEMLAEYRRRRDLMVAGLAAMPGVRCALPAGAFYAYPNIGALLARRGGPATPMEFATRLLHQAGVVTVPGEAFGTSEHVRLSYATSAAAITAGLERFAQFCAALAC
ncbi:MAG: pyridoxal phosphate-dependent aminotransferase [Terriglobales bacterium]